MLNLASLEQPQRAAVLLDDVIRPAMQLLASLGSVFKPDDKRVERLLVAISGQEAEMHFRDQVESNRGDIVLGPALGLWQFEKGSPRTRAGVSGVLLHEASRPWLIQLAAARHISFDADSIWRALKGDDIFAAGVARLLIWTDPFALPETQGAAWDMYVDRLWRPGKPHPQKWPENWRIATQVVYGEG